MSIALVLRGPANSKHVMNTVNSPSAGNICVALVKIHWHKSTLFQIYLNSLLNPAIRCHQSGKCFQADKVTLSLTLDVKE